MGSLFPEYAMAMNYRKLCVAAVGMSVPLTSAAQPLETQTISIGPVTTSNGVGVGDVDNDGRPDVFFLTGTSALLSRQISDRVFSAATPQDFGSGNASGELLHSAFVGFADADGDGRADVAAIGPEGGVELGVGARGHIEGYGVAIWRYAENDAFDYFSGAITGDQPILGAVFDTFDSSPGADLIYFRSSDPDHPTPWTTFYQRGVNDAVVWRSDQPTDVEARITSVAAGDLNSDGLLDLLALDTHQNRALGLLGDAQQSLSHVVLTGTPAGALGAYVGDFNNDGFTDFAVPHAPSGNVSLYLATDHLQFSAPVALSGTSSDAPPYVAADLDADGATDLLYLRAGTQGVVVRRGVGDGSFHAPELLDAGGVPSSFRVTDIFGDGRLEIACSLVAPGLNAGAVSIIRLAAPCPADFNADLAVDSVDLAILLAAWGSTGVDLNGDGVAGSSDLAILLAAWGDCE